MRRRDFLLSSAVAAGVSVLHVKSGWAATKEMRTYRSLGVPLRAGSLTPGNEDDSQAYRDAKLVERLRAAGCKVSDDGDVEIPSYLPHHSVPPIRSWPSPQIAWESVARRIEPMLRQQGNVPLLIGCDCSVVLGTVEALQRTSSKDVYVLYIDGDFDDAHPTAMKSESAASCATWLLTHESPFWTGRTLSKSQVQVIGWSIPSRMDKPAAEAVSLKELRRAGVAAKARSVMAAIPAEASIVLHFDTDVINKAELSSAYFPHDEGMSMAEIAELLRAFAQDGRIRAIEVSEYASLRDFSGAQMGSLVRLLVGALRT